MATKSSSRPKLRKLLTTLDKVTFLCYIVPMRNIKHTESNEPFAVYQHIILRNMWEYYLGEPDENGVAFGYVMGFENEWGSVSMDEIKPYIISVARGDELNYILAPFNYYWEDEKELA